MKLDKSITITLIIVLGVIILALIGFMFVNSLSSANTITTTGEASIKVMPDLVGVYFNVETKAATGQEAKDKNAEIVDKMISSLLEKEFLREAIQTYGFNIYQDYKWVNNNMIEDGFKASHSLKVELSTEDSNKIGGVIDAGVDAGANLNYINFELSQEKQNEYKAKAIKLAAEDARIKAESMAEGLGRKLGRLVSVSDASFGYQPWLTYSAREGVVNIDEAKASTSIQPGEQEIYSSVTAVFKI